MDLYLEDAYDSDSSDPYKKKIRKNKINNNTNVNNSNGITTSNDINNSDDQECNHNTKGNIPLSYENNEIENSVQHDNNNNSENELNEKGTNDNNNTENDKNKQSCKSINSQTYSDSISCNCEMNKQNQLCDKNVTPTNITTIISPNVPKKKTKTKCFEHKI